MEKKQTRRESRETAFLTAFAATFEPETPLVLLLDFFSNHNKTANNQKRNAPYEIEW